MRGVSSGFCVKCQSRQWIERGFVPRIELPVLADIPNADERFYLTRYLRSNIEKDLDEARARCEKHGINYAEARDEARRMT